MNRGLYRDWSPSHQRQHRIYRAFYELLTHPRYTASINRSTLRPTFEVTAHEGADSPMTPEAEKFRGTYRADLVEHHEWLNGGDE